MSKENIMFQLLFALSAVYLAMILTNWGRPDALTSTNDVFGTSSSFAFWIQQIACWVTTLLYLASQVWGSPDSQ